MRRSARTATLDPNQLQVFKDAETVSALVPMSVSNRSTTRGRSNMAKHHNCEGCVYLKFPFGSSEFEEHCVGCQVADVEAMINSLLPFGIEPVYQRTNYLVDKGEK